MERAQGCAWKKISAALVIFLSMERANATELIFGDDVSPTLKARVTELIHQAPSENITLAIGSTPQARELVAPEELTQDETLVVRSRGGIFVATGKGRGVNFAAYELLQQLGYRFFHPFTPQAPKRLNVHDIEVKESPRWPTRGLHLHTQHQIELTHVLNGWGPKGPTDKAGFERLTKQWDLFCEWMIAHRQNTVEWVLLATKTTPNFNDSPERQARLTGLVAKAHAWGLTTGIDVGIVFEQQNMWRLLRKPTKSAKQDAVEIRARTGWLLKAGFDFLTVEAGVQEFRAPDDEKSLAWMNTVVDEAAKHGRWAQAKVHVSHGQATKHFKDPDTREALNFNFLPHYADARLVALPHTVQIYGLDDPAPTYGNHDFSEIRRFMSLEAGARKVIYYPEAAYWCSYDVDVPLFLASYGERRVHDLRLIAADEDAGMLGRGVHKGSRIQGQLLFSSGFEWGYWLNNLVAMHAAWNPHADAASDDAAYRAVLADILRSPSPMIDVLSEQVDAEKDLLIHGRVGHRAPASVNKLNGMAYLAGQETWDELNTFIAEKFKKPDLVDQPSRVGFQFRKKLVVDGVDYVNELAPLLNAMSSRFGALATRAEASAADDVSTELAQSMRMMALRSKQLVALYQAHAYKALGHDDDWFDARAGEARAAVDRAAEIVHARERSYRTDRELIASWSYGPTSYMYGYLWTAHSLMWWYRDEGSALKGGRKNFCFMNIVNPADNVFANGQRTFVYKVLKALDTVPLFGALKECLSPSTSEPNPRQRVRDR